MSAGRPEFLNAVDRPRRMMRSAFLALGGLLPLLVFPCAAADPPTIGDWEISQHETYTDRTLQVSGNVIVARGASLTLERSTLEMMGGPILGHQIIIEPGATLNLTGDSLHPATIRLASSSHRDALSFRLDARQDSTVIGRGCALLGHEASPAWVLAGTGMEARGTNDGFRSAGLVDLRDCVLVGQWHASGGDIRLEKTELESDAVYTLRADGTDNVGKATLTNMTVKTGVQLYGFADVQLLNVSFWHAPLAVQATGGVEAPPSVLLRRTTMRGTCSLQMVGDGTVSLLDSAIDCHDSLSSVSGHLDLVRSTFVGPTHFASGQIEFRVRVNVTGTAGEAVTLVGPNQAPDWDPNSPQVLSGRFDSQGAWSTELVVVRAIDQDRFGWVGDDYRGGWRVHFNGSGGGCFRMETVPMEDMQIDIANLTACPQVGAGGGIFDVPPPSSASLIVLLTAIAVAKRMRKV